MNCLNTKPEIYLYSLRNSCDFGRDNLWVISTEHCDHIQVNKTKIRNVHKTNCCPKGCEGDTKR